MRAIDHYRAVLEKDHVKFADVLRGTGVDANRFLQMALNALSANPDLLNSRSAPEGLWTASILRSVMQAAQLGLELDPNLGHAYLVPRWGKFPGVSMQIGYQGYEHLAYRSGKIKLFSADVVKAEDKFEYQLGTERYITHVPSFKGVYTHAYAIADVGGGVPPAIAVIPWESSDPNVDSVMKARKLSGSDKFWGPYLEPMAKKTAVRRLAPNLPMCPELRRAVAIDERNSAELREADGHVVETTQAALKAKLGLIPPSEAKPTPSEAEAAVVAAPSGGQEDLSFDEEAIPE